jgi:hypothetical protein
MAYPCRFRKKEKEFLFTEPLNDVDGMTGDLFLTSDEKKNSYVLVFLTADKEVIKRTKEYYKISRVIQERVINTRGG